MPASDQFQFLFLFNIIMLHMRPVFALLIGWLGRFCISDFHNKYKVMNNEIHPWIGILKVDEGPLKPDAATVVIMIKEQLALGIASEVASVKKEILRNSAVAMFNTNDQWWECRVKDRILHPEYMLGLMNTIAIIYLNCDEENLYWFPVDWPVDNTTYSQANVFLVGLTDKNQWLQQVTTKMKEVTDSHCEDFYRREKLDYTSLQPKHKLCYREVKSTKSCINDAGMALVVPSGNSWTLIGISILGPGCSLPSRFIEFLPYIPWINSLTEKTTQNFRRTNYWNEENMSEPYDDLDAILLERVNDNTIVLKKSLAYLKEEIRGPCVELNYLILMYKDFGTIRSTQPATAVYSVSLHDLMIPAVTCITAAVMCEKRSKIRFWISTGLGQEDLEDRLKVMLADRLYDLNRARIKDFKVLYLHEEYAVRRTFDTMNIDFKFEFDGEAKFHLEFYGFNKTKKPKLVWNKPYVSIIDQMKEKLGEPVVKTLNASKDNSDSNDTFYYV